MAAWCEVGYVSSFQVARTSCVPLVGSRHIVLLDDLITDSRKPDAGFRVHLLEGASGVGKSRIIREVYGALVSGQSHPGYWPPLRENPANVVATRKVLGPGRAEFKWAADALPDFLWWDIECRISNDRNPSDAITEFSPFLQQHAGAAALAVASRNGLAREVARALATSWRNLVHDVAAESALESMTALLQASGLSAPGVGLAVKELLAAAAWIRDRREAQSRRMADVVLELMCGRAWTRFCA